MMKLKSALLPAAVVGLLSGSGCALVAHDTPKGVPEATASAVALDESISGGEPVTAESLPFVSAIFGDDMVLQRGKRDAIWGWSRPGDSVEVQIGGESASGLADSDGRWQVKIAPPPTGGPYTMEITDGRRRVEIHDVMVGDVWICGGQSNMELPLRFTDNAAEVARQANYPNIRYFTVPERTAYRPVFNLKGSWKVVSPQTAEWLSAVAFYFARRLEQETHVPIGLIVES